MDFSEYSTSLTAKFLIKKQCGERCNSANVGTKDSSEADVRRRLTMAGVVELSGCHS